MPATSKFVSTAIVVLCGAAVLAFHVWAKSRPDPDQLRAYAKGFDAAQEWVGKFAPDFEIATLDGEPFRLRDHVGRTTVVLNFFATWCAPCRAEIPEFARFLRENSATPLTFVGIDVAESRATVEKFLADTPVPYPVAIDDERVARLYGVAAYPTTVVIGVDGRVALYEAGAIMNADVAFAPALLADRRMLAAGEGIDQQRYLDAVAQETYDGLQQQQASDSDTGLTGRARRIAERMPCPCGCTDTVARCTCQTATAIKDRLRRDDFGDASDAEIIEALDREFCVKDGA